MEFDYSLSLTILEFWICWIKKLDKLGEAECERQEFTASKQPHKSTVSTELIVVVCSIHRFISTVHSIQFLLRVLYKCLFLIGPSQRSPYYGIFFQLADIFDSCQCDGIFFSKPRLPRLFEIVWPRNPNEILFGICFWSLVLNLRKNVCGKCWENLPAMNFWLKFWFLAVSINATIFCVMSCSTEKVFFDDDKRIIRIRILKTYSFYHVQSKYRNSLVRKSYKQILNFLQYSIRHWTSLPMNLVISPRFKEGQHSLSLATRLIRWL